VSLHFGDLEKVTSFIVLRSVVEVEALIRACRFVDCKVLRHQVSVLAGPVHSCEDV